MPGRVAPEEPSKAATAPPGRGSTKPPSNARIGPPLVTLRQMPSGRSNIVRKGHFIEVQSVAGFPSIRANVRVTSGKWYYEMKLTHVTCMQLGWATNDFEPTKPENGVGDDTDSYGWDAGRLSSWYNGQHNYGSTKWKDGDVIGFMLDLDSSPCTMAFHVNGISQGIAFKGFSFGTGLAPAGSFSVSNSALYSFRQENWKYSPPAGYRAFEVTADVRAAGVEEEDTVEVDTSQYRSNGRGSGLAAAARSSGGASSSASASSSGGGSGGGSGGSSGGSDGDLAVALGSLLVLGALRQEKLNELWGLMTDLHQSLKKPFLGNVSLTKPDSISGLYEALAIYEAAIHQQAQSADWARWKRKQWLDAMKDTDKYSGPHFATCLFAVERHLLEQAQDPLWLLLKRESFVLGCKRAGAVDFPFRDPGVGDPVLTAAILATLLSGSR